MYSDENLPSFLFHFSFLWGLGLPGQRARGSPADSLAAAARPARSSGTLQPGLDGGTELCVSALGEEEVVLQKAVEVSPKASASGPSQLQQDPPVAPDRGPALPGGNT